MTSADSYDGSTTRELTSIAPKRPLLGLAVLLFQLILIAGAVALSVWTNLPTGVPLSIGVIVALLFLVSGPTLGWQFRHGKSRLITSKKLSAVDSGMWLVRPGTRYAVRVYNRPTGSPRNPTIADGLTQEELAIIAPVYSFEQEPKGSRPS